ncbi:MAG TPA: hypothetical protein VJA66_12395, partial [Thermoanaerobaculia bacterium]
DTFKRQQQVPSLGTDPVDAKPPVFGAARPDEGKTGNEAFGERSQRFDGEFALQTVRTPDHADEKK